jgi:hypothetical protein
MAGSLTQDRDNESKDETMQRKFGGLDHQSPGVLNDHSAFLHNNK